MVSAGHLPFVNRSTECAPRGLELHPVRVLFSLSCCRMAWWESNHYQSFCLPSEESEPEDLEQQEDESSAQLDHEESDSPSIMYVSGDVTHPQAGAEDAIIVHCIGRRGWGPQLSHAKNWGS